MKKTLPSSSLSSTFNFNSSKRYWQTSVLPSRAAKWRAPRLFASLIAATVLAKSLSSLSCLAKSIPKRMNQMTNLNRKGNSENETIVRKRETITFQEIKISNTGCVKKLLDFLPHCNEKRRHSGKLRVTEKTVDHETWDWIQH